MYPFLISPYCERVEFWTYILKNAPRQIIRGVLPEDAGILPMFGYGIDVTSQVMCRPADTFSIDLPEGFSSRPFGSEDIGDEAGKVVMNSYKGGICNEINGEATLAQTIDDMKSVLRIYEYKNFSKLIIDNANGKAAAICLAGISEKSVHHYTEIADLCVLPAYRGLGLAKYLVGATASAAVGSSPFVKLFVYVGNTAEALYRSMNFIPGPRFSLMTKRAFGKCEP